VPAQIDLVVNSFERTYRQTIALGVFPRIEEENCRAFARRIALIKQRRRSRRRTARARSCSPAARIDAYVLVADHLERACRSAASLPQSWAGSRTTRTAPSSP